MSKLRVLLESVIAQEPLAVQHRDHPLRGIWKGHREAHIEPDWLVIYYAVLARGGDRWGSPNFGREPPYHHAGQSNSSSSMNAASPSGPKASGIAVASAE